MRRRTSRIVVAALLSFGPPALALADGGFFSRDIAVSADQRALLIQSGNTVSLTVSTGYTGTGDDFGWVIPLPATPAAEDVAEVKGAAELLDYLEMVTAPRVGYQTGGGGGFSCLGCMGATRDGSPSSAPLVTVVGRAELESYEIAVLEAGDAGALLAWLTDNGYKVAPEAREVLDLYVAESWSFLAVKLKPAEDRQYNNEALPPVTVRMATGRMVFPLRISRVSTGAEVEIAVYTLAESTCSPSSHKMAPLPYRSTIQSDIVPEDYIEDAIKQGVEEAGGGFTLMSAGPFNVGSVYGLSAEPADIQGSELPGEGMFLTRIETRMAPADMDRDLTLELDPEEVHFRVDIYQVSGASDPGRGRMATVPRGKTLPTFAMMAFVIGLPIFLRRRARR